MARPLRIEYEGAWYHVMNRGAGKREIFRKPEHRHRFLSLLGDLHERFCVETHAYCLMGNHYHLLLRTPLANLSLAMRHLDGVYAQYFNRASGTDGPLFRGRYLSVVVDADTYLLQVSRYIHRNPLEAGLVDELCNWRWSSYPCYLGQTKAPGWLCQGEIKSAFGTDMQNYRAFVENVIETDVDVRVTEHSALPILGDGSFRERTLSRFDGDARETTDLRRPAHAPPTPQQIVEYVTSVLGVDSSIAYRAARGRAGPNMPRLMSMYLCQQVGRMSLKEISDFLGLKHYGSVSSQIARYRDLRTQRPDLLRAEDAARRRLEMIEEQT